jgi:hypothetical protein
VLANSLPVRFMEACFGGLSAKALLVSAPDAPIDG